MPKATAVGSRTGGDSHEHFQKLAGWIPEQIEASTVVSAVRPEMLESDHVHDELLTYLLAPQTVRQLLFVDFRSGLGVTTPSYTGKIDHRKLE